METCPFFVLSRFSTNSLSSRKSLKRSTTLFPPSKQMLHKSQFLQKLTCQKPYWDQARLSSLVNKQVVSPPPPGLVQQQHRAVRGDQDGHQRPPAQRPEGAGRPGQLPPLLQVGGHAAYPSFTSYTSAGPSAVLLGSLQQGVGSGDNTPPVSLAQLGGYEENNGSF